MTGLNDALPIIATVISLFGLIGGILAFRQSYSKATNEIQDKVITALKTQNETQASQIGQLEKEISRLNRVVRTIRVAMQRRGLTIKVAEEYVEITEGSKVTTVELKAAKPKEEPKEEET